VPDPLRVCMLSGSFEYDSEESLGLFSEHLATVGGFADTLVVYQDEDDDLSLAAIEDTDVLLVFTRRIRVDGPELERVKAYCAAGRPIVGVRTASHAYQNWLEFDGQVLGGSYTGHFGSGPACRVAAADAAAGHPILERVPAFDSIGSLYKNTPIARDATLLLNGATPDSTEPVAWTRVHNGGRVFYTSLGHQQDFRETEFLTLLTNGTLWAGGRI
jgi:type 1 glutamine amidotransferase